MDLVQIYRDAAQGVSEDEIMFIDPDRFIENPSSPVERYQNLMEFKRQFEEQFPGETIDLDNNARNVVLADCNEATIRRE